MQRISFYSLCAMVVLLIVALLLSCSPVVNNEVPYSFDKYMETHVVSLSDGNAIL